MVQKHGGWLYIQQTGPRHLSTHNRDVSPRPNGLAKSETPTCVKEQFKPY